MNKLKAFIADDSAIYRKSIQSALKAIDWIEVEAALPNGRLAIERMADSMPDLLILDMEMPEMDGIQTLKEMKKRGWNCTTLVFSSISKRGTEITLEALNLGAKDFVTKPNSENATDGMSPIDKIRSLLVPKLEELFPTHKRGHTPETDKPLPIEAFHKVNWDLLNPQIIVIGSSTGGPTALEKIFSGLSAPLSCPVVIAQHMPPVFTTSFAERLSKISGITVTEAKHGEVLEKSHVYIVPGDYHLRLSGTPEKIVASLDQGPLIHSVRPAVDPLFQTAAEIFGSRCLGFILTGMGFDGRDGAIAVKLKGGAVVIQSEESCVVFGMPGAVFKAGAFDRTENLEGVISVINEKAGNLLRARSCG